MPGFYEACTYPSPLWPQVQSYYSQTFRDFAMKPHAHEACELMYVFSGVCCIKTEKMTIELRAGTYIFLDSFVSHDLQVPGEGCTMLNVEFTFASADGLFSLQDLCGMSPYFKQFSTYGAPFFIGDDTDGEIFRALDILVLGLSVKKPRDPCLSRGEMTTLLFTLSQNLWENRTRVRGDRYVRGAMLYIRQHFREPITLADIAESCGVSPDHLGRVFRAQTGWTVHGFLTRMRCEHAQNLLMRMSESLDEIARQCGFSSRQQFDRDFTKLYKLTPARYRRDSTRIQTRSILKLSGEAETDPIQAGG
ncbi:MAG: helix-turn-helix domain-containing protein [Oscillospiraceae bacterium]|nr:helix-turn-helix domain-containing protein [Oscillospiraceae bacterium]